MPHPIRTPARWPFELPPGLPDATVEQIAREAQRIASESQYGWGQTVDFGRFRIDGLLGLEHLRIAGGLDEWGWWPGRLDGMKVADVGCFTGALSLLMAHRGAEVVYAVDEIPQHLEQCAFLARTFDCSAVRPVLDSAYRLGDHVAPGSLDLVLLSGVLYHMSDMLVGLHAMRDLLKPGGLLLIQSNAIDDFEHSYANFGRFVAGRWWQPTALCLTDMLEFMGMTDSEVRFYEPQYCIARAYRSTTAISFKRGLNWKFDDPRDAVLRPLDAGIMAPLAAPDDGGTTPLPTR